MKSILAVFISLFAASSASADWQTQHKGNYVYYVDGTNIALPAVRAGWMFYKMDRGNGAWEFFHPTSDKDYSVVYADGKRMFSKTSVNAPYAVLGCELPKMKAYFDEQYKQMTQNMNSDFSPYYQAMYQEAEILFRTCKATHGG